MRARVSGLVWLPKEDLGRDGSVFLKQELTIVPRNMGAGFGDGEPPGPIQCWDETADELGVPRDYFFSTATASHDVAWELSDGHEAGPYESLISQDGDYAEQGVVVDTFWGWFDGFRTEPAMSAGRRLGAILRADPGFGKTQSALALAHRLRRTALIVVHKDFLLTQWMKRIEKCLPGARVGVVRETECDFEGKDFVVAMAQSLALEGRGEKSRYPPEFYRWPGVVFLDELHRIGAPTWSPIPKLFPAKFRVGLTATPRRRDGADKVFWWHVGEVRYSAKTERPKPAVRMIDAGTSGPPVLMAESTPKPVVVNILGRLKQRNRVIITEIGKALRSPAQRKIMVLSERLEHLYELDRLLRGACERNGLTGITTGFYTGERFTGEMAERMVKGAWSMEGGGRERAFKVIHAALARRKKPRARTEGGERQVYLPWRVAAVDSMANWVVVEGGILGGELLQWASLDELSDGDLFEIARHYEIKQKIAKKKVKQTEADLAEAERARVIWATFQMTAEGVDVPAVDTIVFATPISDVEQAYGRGRRVCVPVAYGGKSSPEACEHYCSWRAATCQGKPPGVTVDIADSLIPLGRTRKKYRMEFYRSLGVKVVEKAAS